MNSTTASLDNSTKVVNSERKKIRDIEALEEMRPSDFIMDAKFISGTLDKVVKQMDVS